MTGGIGGSSYEKELECLQPQKEYKPIDNHEREIRIEARAEKIFSFKIQGQI